MTTTGTRSDPAEAARAVIDALPLRPREWSPLTATPVAASTELEEVRVQDLPDQAYRLVTAPAPRLEYADDAGLRYGRATWEALCDLADPVPAVGIRDEPTFAARGFMLDISRGRVPTRATLARLVEILADARYNQLQLYTEHTFAYAGYEQVWGQASPMTVDDIRWLDVLCAERGIELVPSQNVFGHMERWFVADPALLARAECVDGFDRDGVHHAPTTLAPTPENAAWVGGLLAEVLPAYTSRTVNIGCDEPFELGLGVSRHRAETEGLGRVFLDYVTAVSVPLVERGYAVQLWADVVSHDPETAAALPEGVTPIAWWYERPYPDPAASPWGEAPFRDGTISAVDGTPVRNGFDDRVRALDDAGRDYWVAPGTGAWRSILGRTTNAYPNLRRAAEFAGPRCPGYLVTHWGDLGAWEHPSFLMGPLWVGGALAWNADDEPEERLGVLLSERVFQDPTGGVAAALERAGAVWDQLGVPVFNASPVFLALTDPDPRTWPYRPSQKQVDAVTSSLLEAGRLLADARPRSSDAADVVAEIAAALDLARFAVRRLAPAAHAEPTSADGHASDADELRDLLGRHARCWLARARPGGLADSMAELTVAEPVYGVDPRAVAGEVLDRWSAETGGPTP